MLKIKNLQKSFDNNFILKSINIELNKGEIVCLLGKNGVGKTTLIKIITGILKKDSGEISINNINIDENNLQYKKSFGYVPDDTDFFNHLTGFEYLNFLINIYKLEKENAKNKISNLISQLSLENHIDNKIEHYSKGTKKKLLLIGGIIHNPNMLILDEPFTGLDIEAIQVTKSIFKQFIYENRTVLFSTHIVEIVQNIGDRILIINDGIIKNNLNKNELINIDLEKLLLKK